jgi:N6-adenosine-specific RNA methylase IME4
VKFSVLEADPPWKFGDNLPGKGRGAAKHYPCMTIDELRGFPLPPLADDAVLLLWLCLVGACA